MLPLVILGFFFVIPLISVVLESFSGPIGRLEAYSRILADGSLLGVFLYTFQVATIVTACSLLLSYPVAFIAAAASSFWQAFMLIAILVPFWTSAVIRSFAWLVLLQRQGIINDALLWLGVVDAPVRLANSELGMHIAMVQVMLPFMMLPLLNGMRGIDRNLLRAGAILGANPFQQFVTIFLPQSLPAVRAGCILVFISSLGFYITPALLGGDKLMIAVLIEQQASVLLDWPMASALATFLLLATLVLFVIYEQVRRRAALIVAAV